MISLDLFVPIRLRIPTNAAAKATHLLEIKVFILLTEIYYK